MKFGFDPMNLFTFNDSGGIGSLRGCGETFYPMNNSTARSALNYKLHLVEDPRQDMSETENTPIIGTGTSESSSLERIMSKMLEDKRAMQLNIDALLLVVSEMAAQTEKVELVRTSAGRSSESDIHLPRLSEETWKHT